MKYINNLTKIQIFLVGDIEKDEPVTPCGDVYRSKIQSDGSLDKLKLIILIIGDLYHKDLIGDNWSPTASLSN